MNQLEYVLCVVAEECDEVGQRCMKALRFGIDETQPGQPLTNEDRIWQEVSDLQGALEMLIELRGGGNITREAVDAKKAKVRRFMRYSEELGCLQRGKNEQPV